MPPLENPYHSAFICGFKLGGLLQEADETQLWIELLIDDCHIHDPSLPVIHRDASDLIAILTTIISRVRPSHFISSFSC